MPAAPPLCCFLDLSGRPRERHTHTWSPGGGGDPRGACPGSPVCGAFISPPAWRPSSTITQVDPAAAGGLETRLHASGLRSSSLGALFPPSSPLLFISSRRSDGSSERRVCDVSQTRPGPNILFTNPQHSADRNNGELMRGKVWKSLQFVGVTAKVAAFSVTHYCASLTAPGGVRPS